MESCHLGSCQPSSLLSADCTTLVTGGRARAHGSSLPPSLTSISELHRILLAFKKKTSQPPASEICDLEALLQASVLPFLTECFC